MREHHVPTDPQVPRRVLGRGDARQLQGVSLEAFRVTAARRGEGHLHLTHHAAVPAADARHRKLDLHRLPSEGDRAEPPQHLPLGKDPLRAADGARQALTRLPNHQRHPAPLKPRALIVVATDAKPVVQ